MPPTVVLVFGTLIPIAGIIGFFGVIYIFIKLHYKKVNAMIEKGIYESGRIKFKWELLFLFIGLILVFLGPGISLVLIGVIGLYVQSLVMGAIPLLLGIALVHSCLTCTE